MTGFSKNKTDPVNSINQVCDKPFLILERPIQSTPTNFGAFEGFMSNNYARIGNLSGYTEFDPDTVWSDFGKATEEESNMIKDILNGGVYL